MPGKQRKTVIRHSDQLLEAIRKASGEMSLEEYANLARLDKEYVFKILKGEIETVDNDTYQKLTLQNHQ